MCTRYYLEKENPAIAEVIEKASHSVLLERWMNKYGKPFLMDGEVRPTDLVPVIAANQKGDRSAFPMKWGYSLPNSNKPIVNARSETAAVKPLFKDDWKSHRCIVPASYYFEWEHIKINEDQTKTGRKFMFQPKGSTTTWLCGIYRMENSLPVFAVLTREPSEELSHFHDRMPLILPEEMIDNWISPQAVPEDLLKYALTDMIYESEQ